MKFSNNVFVRLTLVAIGTTLVAVGSYRLGKERGQATGMMMAMKIIEKTSEEFSAQAQSSK